jgi:membrane-associated phospholipid phosphatase
VTGEHGGSGASWWRPRRPARLSSPATEGVLTAFGVVLFAGCALLGAVGTTGWDAELFRVLNEVPPGLATLLTPLSRLFLAAGLSTAAILALIYVVIRNRSALPVLVAATAAAVAFLAANLAKIVADRSRPYEVITHAVLRQQPAHGTSFPSSHTAVAVATVIALRPFVARPVAVVAVGYAVLVGLSRVYVGVHYPLDVLAGAGIGMAVGGVALLVSDRLLRDGRAGPRAGGSDP